MTLTELEGQGDKMRHGWFSLTQAKMTGTNIYLTKDGREVEITEVKESPDISNFPDAVYLGFVTKWIRQGTPARSFSNKFIW